MGKKCVVLLSGGMDSATLLAFARQTFEQVTTLSVFYGQRHGKELQCASALSKFYKVGHIVLEMPKVAALLQGSALTTPQIAVPEGHYRDETMRTTVVPGRNTIMLSIAYGYATSIGFDTVSFAAHAGDHCIPHDEWVTTEKGKKKVIDLQEGDFVLSQNLSTGELSFRKVLRKVDVGLRSDILSLVVRGGRNLRLTSNHKVFRVIRSDFHQHRGWKKTVEEIPARDLKIGDWLLTPARGFPGLLDGFETSSNESIDLLQFCPDHKQLDYDDKHIWFKETNKVSRYVSRTDFTKLLAWYLTEGNIGSGTDPRANSFRVGISQSKEKNPGNFEEILSVAKAWGFRPTEGPDMIWFSGPTTNVFRMCGNRAEVKEIPAEFTSLQINFQVLLETLIKGDGCQTTESGFQFVTKSPSLKEQVCWLCTVLGFSVGVNVNSQGIFYISCRKDFKKSMNAFGESRMVEIIDIVEDEPAFVFDLEVDENHNFVAGSGSGLLVSNSIYPDCRKEYVDALREVFKIGHYYPVEIWAPFIDIDKTEILRRGLSIGVPYALTWTCYKGGELACGRCGSCVERLEAFDLNNARDPIAYEKHRP